MDARQLEQQYQELKILNSIAVRLNGAVELNKAMQVTLEDTVKLMNMRTGWIWLVHPSSNSVFLAASYKLPPAFTQHPERLSGQCYCIQKYLDDHLDAATNISEITCTRLKNIEEGTDGLKFHATIPLFDQKQKIGLLNLVSATSVKLSGRHLEMLHTIGELLSTAVVRTRHFEKSKEAGALEERQRLSQSFYNNLLTKIEKLQSKIEELRNSDTTAYNTQRLTAINRLSSNITSLTKDTLNDLKQTPSTNYQNQPLQYPTTPLTNRELEVLQLLKKGRTNKAIATELFISERTVKFHVSTLLSKLGAKNRTEAVRIAVRRGIIEMR